MPQSELPVNRHSTATLSVFEFVIVILSVSSITASPTLNFVDEVMLYDTVGI
jgi:hypothetical protein